MCVCVSGLSPEFVFTSSNWVTTVSVNRSVQRATRSRALLQFPLRQKHLGSDNPLYVTGTSRVLCTMPRLVQKQDVVLSVKEFHLRIVVGSVHVELAVVSAWHAFVYSAFSSSAYADSSSSYILHLPHVWKIPPVKNGVINFRNVFENWTNQTIHLSSDVYNFLSVRRKLKMHLLILLWFGHAGMAFISMPWVFQMLFGPSCPCGHYLWYHEYVYRVLEPLLRPLTRDWETSPTLNNGYAALLDFSLHIDQYVY